MVGLQAIREGLPLLEISPESFMLSKEGVVYLPASAASHGGFIPAVEDAKQQYSSLLRTAMKLCGMNTF